MYIDHNINATMQPAYYTSTNSRYTLVVSVTSHTVLLHNNSNIINTVVSEVSHNTAIWRTTTSTAVMEDTEADSMEENSNNTKLFTSKKRPH